MDRLRKTFLHCLAFAIALLALLPLHAQTPDPTAADPEKAVASAQAQATALAWLGLVDAGGYEGSWQTAATYFQKNVTQDQWVAGIKGVRPALGDVVTRQLKKSSFMTSLAGAPDGQYVVMQFETEYSQKKNAVETVTAMREPDGSWKIAGYYIK